MRTVRKEKAKKQAAPQRNMGRGGFPALPAGAKAVDVVGLGENSVDLVAVVPRFPRPDTKQTLARLGPLVGGQAATAMVACARLGWRARYLGGVGDDEDGRRVTDALGRAGVDVRVQVRPGIATRRAVVIVEARTGRRAILEHRDPAVALRVDELDPALVTSGRVLLLDARDLEVSCAAARVARAAGVPVVLDVDRAAPGLEGASATGPSSSVARRRLLPRS